MKRMIYLMLAALFVGLTGCGGPKVAATAIDRQTTDSVIVVETLRDTVVRIEADSSLLRALVECDSLGQAHLRELLEYQAGDRLKPPQVVIRDNVLTATAEVDSMAIYLRLKDRYEERFRTDRKTETVYVETNKLTWFQTLFYRLGLVLTAAAVGWTIYKLAKRR